ncbi:MAG: hypothetical protein JW863_18765 [Chitinispirillaceae bacterium]|nr:hypothetical protein [Chitinispirillaceae bacterium]
MDYYDSYLLMLLLQNRYPGGGQRFYEEDHGSVISVKGIPDTLAVYTTGNLFDTNNILGDFTAGTDTIYYTYDTPAYDVAREQEIHQALKAQWKNTAFESTPVTLGTALVVIDLSTICNYQRGMADLLFKIDGLNRFCITDGTFPYIHERSVIQPDGNADTIVHAGREEADIRIKNNLASSAMAHLAARPVSRDDITNLKILLGTSTMVEELLDAL